MRFEIFHNDCRVVYLGFGYLILRFAPLLHIIEANRDCTEAGRITFCGHAPLIERNIGYMPKCRRIILLRLIPGRLIAESGNDAHAVALGIIYALAVVIRVSQISEREAVFRWFVPELPADGQGYCCRKRKQFFISRIIEILEIEIRFNSMNLICFALRLRGWFFRRYFGRLFRGYFGGFFRCRNLRIGGRGGGLGVVPGAAAEHGKRHNRRKNQGDD